MEDRASQRGPVSSHHTQHHHAQEQQGSGSYWEDIQASTRGPRQSRDPNTRPYEYNDNVRFEKKILQHINSSRGPINSDGPYGSSPFRR